MDTGSYLRRINYKGNIVPAYETLRQLHLAHLMSVPFENLSIHMNEPIILNEQSLFEKIILRKRGGFCYELNGLFAALLKTLGFNVTMLSAGVAKADGGFKPDFDHMTLLVMLDKPMLADVGFGDSFLEPLILEPGLEQVQGSRTFRIDPEGDSLILMLRNGNGMWKAQYRFSLTPHEYPDYYDMCRYHQTSPDSHFTRRRICSLALPDGRVTLSDKRLIITRNGRRQERELTDSDEYNEALRKHFGIILPGHRHYFNDLSMQIPT